MSFNCIGCVDGIPLICGCMERRRRQRTPPQEWRSILASTPTYYCTQCACMQPGACYRNLTYFTLFCIPLFPVNRGQIWLGCLVCGQRVETRSAQQLCDNCGMFEGMQGIVLDVEGLKEMNISSNK